MRVLIVDDSNVVIQRLTSRLVEVTGIEIVGHADNVVDAVREIRKAQPDVVILDIGLPGGSGIDVLESLKEDQFNCPYQPAISQEMFAERGKLLP